MIITTEILNTLERESMGASTPMLERCIRFIHAGIANAPPEVKAHGHVLMLRLEHMVLLGPAALELLPRQCNPE